MVFKPWSISAVMSAATKPYLITAPLLYQQVKLNDDHSKEIEHIHQALLSVIAFGQQSLAGIHISATTVHPLYHTWTQHPQQSLCLGKTVIT